MCRLFYIEGNCRDTGFLEEMITNLNKEAGGDGIGIGWFENGVANIFKGENITPLQMAVKISTIDSDHGIIGHVRRASVGDVNDTNCHPYIHNNEITIHNGSLEGSSVLKLMMLENIEKYAVDGWTTGLVASTTDSDIIAYFISKRGFSIASMVNSGTIITMYPTGVKMYNGYCLEAIEQDGLRIYASAFPPESGLLADMWVIFIRGSELSIDTIGDCSFVKGACYDGKEAWALAQKKTKKGAKKKDKVVEV